jgi:type VI secretion system protein ImpF
MRDNRGRSGSEHTNRRAQLPLLDRLIDADRDERDDRPLSPSAALAALRDSVCRDLEELLNARRRWRSWDPRLTELDSSLAGYGLPDFAAGAFNDQRRREELRQLVEGCIRRFEPRIVSLTVTLLPNPDQHTPTLRLRIDALLRADPAPEPIIFDTRVDLDTKNVTVSATEG